MIVVDSSVWIDYFIGQSTAQTDFLHNILGEREIVVGDLVLTEVLQGFRNDADFRRARGLLESFRQEPMVGPAIAIRAAQNYRKLRNQGITVRKTIDVLIGTFCIEHHNELLFSDRDFDPMVQHLGLKMALP